MDWNERACLSLPISPALLIRDERQIQRWGAQATVRPSCNDASVPTPAYRSHQRDRALSKPSKFLKRPLPPPFPFLDPSYRTRRPVPDHHVPPRPTSTTRSGSPSAASTTAALHALLDLAIESQLHSLERQGGVHESRQLGACACDGPDCIPSSSQQHRIGYTAERRRRRIRHVQSRPHERRSSSTQRCWIQRLGRRKSGWR